MNLTIGMATYRDYDGVYFTIQALRYYHDMSRFGKVEFLVIDNDPSGRDGDALRNFLAWVRGQGTMRYVHAPEVVGTSAPRDRVFQEAQGDIVLCIDSHVLLAPGAIDHLADFYQKNPESKDLIQGPLVYDDLVGMSTHFDRQWRSEMWGTWREAWYCPCGGSMVQFNVEFKPGDSKPDISVRNLEGTPVTYCDACGRRHDQDVTNMHQAMAKGYTRAAGDPGTIPEPFEIPGQGLGLFGCRKDAWLGFNKRFREFGGEENYIHIKYQKAGRRTLCLPGLRWLHRFGRPDGVRYPLNRRSKVRNYVIGHRELQLPLDQCHHHFVNELGMPEQEWQEIVREADDPTEQVKAAGGCGTCAKRVATSPNDWLKQSEGTDGRIRILRDIADRCETIVEFQDKRNVLTAVLMSSKAKRLLSNTSDVPSRLDGHTSRQKSGLMMTIGNGTPQKAEPTECDLLLIDGRHADDLVRDLERHHGKVKRWVAVVGKEMHNGGPGVLPGLRVFLRSHPEYTAIKAADDLLILSKADEDKQKLPPTWKQIWTYSKALVKDAANGFGTASEEVQEQRLAICSTCPFRNGTACGRCGCPLDKKVSYPRESCPVGHWHPV